MDREGSLDSPQRVFLVRKRRSAEDEQGADALVVHPNR